jgi:exodeoxyribonuclease VII large subunit
VADVRAPTPTAAAEIVVPQRSELLRQIDELSRRIHDVERWFSPLLQAVDELSDRLSRRVGAVIEQHALHLKAAEAHLKSLRPTELLRLFAQRITLLQQRLSHTVSPDKFKELHARVRFAESRLTSLSVRAHERASHALEQLAQRFETVSPIQVLKRGYALVEKEGVLVRSTEQIRSSDLVSVRVSDGAFTAKVSEVDSGH